MSGPDARAVVLTRLRALSRRRDSDEAWNPRESRDAFATIADAILDGLGASREEAPREAPAPARPPASPVPDLVEKLATLLRHVIARPGSLDVRDRAQAFLDRHGLATGALLPVEGIAPPAAPEPVTLTPCEPLDPSSLAIARRSGLLPASTPDPRLRVKPAASFRLSDVPAHSSKAVWLGLEARAAGTHRSLNPFHGSRGIAGARRVWWERGRSGAVVP